MSKQIVWRSVLVEVKNIQPTPKNYKIKTELGMERLQASLGSFGLAGNVVCNWGKKVGDISQLVLIDGNSRREEAIAKGTKKIWASVPDRVLNPKEFTEMSAMFDVAKAGEIDMERINQDLGTTKAFYEKYKLEVPLELLNKMGAKAAPTNLEYPEEGGGKGKSDLPVSDIKMVQLFFNEKQEAEFRKIEVKLKKLFKVDNTTDVVLRAFRKLNK